MRWWSHPGGSTTTKSPPKLSPPHTKPQYEGFKNNTSAGENSARKVMLWIFLVCQKKHNIWSLFFTQSSLAWFLLASTSAGSHIQPGASLCQLPDCQIARLPNFHIAQLRNCSTKTYYTAQVSEQAPNRLWEVATRELTISPLEVEIQVAYWYGDFRRSDIVQGKVYVFRCFCRYLRGIKR